MPSAGWESTNGDADATAVPKLGLPAQPPAVTGYDVALVRDGRIAVLYTLINGLTDRD